MTTNAKKRLGRVCIDFGYIVDLDNAEMIEDAKQCLVEDMRNAFKFGEIGQYIAVEAAPDATAIDIPEHLQPFHSEVFDDD